MVNHATILVSAAEGIATVTLNRAEKCNAMDGGFIHDLFSTLKKLAEDNKIGVVIINANGAHFCAGADIAWMQKMAQATKEENFRDAMQLAELMQLINLFPKPVIALVQGATMGGGLGIVAACDIVIAEKNASFSFSEVKIGIAPSVVSPYIIAAIGEKAARYYFLTAERFGADEARRIGLVNQVTDIAALHSVGVAVAQALLKNSPNALAEVKRLVDRVSRENISDKLIEFTAEHLATLRTSSEAREGLQAFLEKREPHW